VLEPEGLREALVRETKLLARVYGMENSKEQDPMISKLLRLWGKTPYRSQNPDEYHPAIYHMLDVGNVAQTLLSGKSSLRWRRVLANVFGTDEDSLADWLPWLVALHDIGKISEAFQEKNEAQKKRLMGEGVPFKKNGWQGKPYHFDVSEAFILTIAESLSLPDGLRETWQAVVSGHHGWFCGNEMRGQTMRDLQVESQEWQKWRIEASELLKSALLRQPLVQWPTPPNISAATMALTGFTILCDWLGFGREFTMQPEMAWEDYLQTSVTRARRVVESVGFQRPSQSHAPTTFVELFPDSNLQPPRPLQIAIDEIPADLLTFPCLAIIEAPTGEGKTEAALALAHRLAQAHGTDELYYALPTMATSNQMYKRLKKHLIHRLGFPDGSIQLIYGQSFLMEDDEDDPLESALNLGEATDRPAAQTWIGADKRKSILMPFGVGTIDQAELAALHVRYVALRLAGLAGKVVILDEVHAYDTYMTTIVEMLLQWFSALGTSVILLSATLPKAQRAKLAQAYGVKLEPGDDRLNKYPSLFVASRADTPPHYAQPKANQPDRRIKLDKGLCFSDDEPEAKAAWLLKAVEHGGCACWITNTVERAQKLFEQLDKLSSPEISLMLLHASLPLDERLKREEELTALYGRDGKRRPCKGIVIGTQVLEQSLDLDFDIMVSDLAPIDFLLQRAGRLHRHQRGERGLPCLYLNIKIVDGKLELTDTDTWIYDEYLLRLTWAALETKSEINLPEDYRPLIESVYAAPEPMQDSPLRQAWEEMDLDRKSAREDADKQLIPVCSADYSFRVELTNPRRIDDENSAGYLAARTRREAESVTIIPLERTGNRVRFVTAKGKPVELNANQVAPPKMERQILRRMVRVSRKAALTALRQYQKDEKDVPLFADSFHLSEYLPLWLTNGQKSLQQGNNTIHFRLDPKLGLVIEKEKGVKG
jgi:CRISPR-associated endonuclease/helicase Cas3